VHDFDQDPISLKETDAAKGSVKKVEFEKQDWSISFETSGAKLAVARRIGGGQEKLRTELLALRFYQPEPELLRKELAIMAMSDLAKRAVAKCSALPIETKWLVKKCDCTFSFECQYCEQLPKEKLVDVILASPSTLRRGIARAIARWKGLDAT